MHIGLRLLLYSTLLLSNDHCWTSQDSIIQTVSRHVVLASAGTAVGALAAKISGQASAKTGMALGSTTGFIASCANDMVTSTYQHQPKIVLNEPLLPANAPVKILYCHGVGGDSAESAPIIQHNLDIPLPMIGFDFPCSAKHVAHIKNPNIRFIRTFSRCNFAQNHEIDYIVDNYRKVVHQGEKVIFFGFSNGGSGAITTAGSHDLRNAAALVVIAPYDDPRPLMRTLAGHFTGAAQGFLGLTSGYNPHGIRPDTVVTKISPTIPVFIACSTQDTATGTGGARLAHALAAAGHPQVHLVILEQGSHNDLLSSESHTLRNALHAFFKKIGCAYNQNHARCYDIEKAFLKVTLPH